MAFKVVKLLPMRCCTQRAVRTVRTWSPANRCADTEILAIAKIPTTGNYSSAAAPASSPWLCGTARRTMIPRRSRPCCPHAQPCEPPSPSRKARNRADRASTPVPSTRCTLLDRESVGEQSEGPCLQRKSGSVVQPVSRGRIVGLCCHGPLGGSMGPRGYSPEFGRRVVDLVEAGRLVAGELGVSGQSI